MGSSDLTLYRSAEVTADGRTLSGVAVPFGKPSLVSDFGGPAYREGFHRAAFTKSLKDRAGRPYPLKVMHAGAGPTYPGDPTPLGAVSFRATPEHLAFEARVSKTQRGDEALELLSDGIFGDVSVGYRVLRSRPARDAQGEYVERAEAALLELSLAIVGTGQHEGAQVLAVRTATSELSHLDELRRRRSLLLIP